MSKTDITTVLTKARKHPLVEVHSGASENEIKLLLRLLRVKLPKNYLTFLRTVGWMDINGDVIFGSGPDATEAESLADVSTIARVDYMVRPMYVPIASDGSGSFYCLDVENTVGDDCPVVFWDTALPDAEFHTPPAVAGSFVAYLEKLLDDAPTM